MADVRNMGSWPERIGHRYESYLKTSFFFKDPRPSRLVPDHSSTSATLSSGQSEADRHAVAEFANELFGESFSAPSIVFSESQVAAADGPPRRYHAFLRALEGVFLVRLRPSRTPTRDLHNLTLSQYLLGPTSRIGWKPISSTDC